MVWQWRGLTHPGGLQTGVVRPLCQENTLLQHTQGGHVRQRRGAEAQVCWRRVRACVCACVYEAGSWRVGVRQIGRATAAAATSVGVAVRRGAMRIIVVRVGWLR